MVEVIAFETYSIPFKAFAVSNASKSIGKIFGSDLNNDELSQIFNVYGL